jgi:hypothetical protein
MVLHILKRHHHGMITLDYYCVLTTIENTEIIKVGFLTSPSPCMQNSKHCKLFGTSRPFIVTVRVTALNKWKAM